MYDKHGCLSHWCMTDMGVYGRHGCFSRWWEFPPAGRGFRGDFCFPGWEKLSPPRTAKMKISTSIYTEFTRNSPGNRMEIAETSRKSWKNTKITRKSHKSWKITEITRKIRKSHQNHTELREFTRNSHRIPQIHPEFRIHPEFTRIFTRNSHGNRKNHKNPGKP